MELIKALAESRHAIAVGHVRPDADALGAMCAVAKVWGKACNRRPLVSLPPDSVSRKLRFLIDWADVDIAGDHDFLAADSFVVLDTARKSRCAVGRDRPQTWADDKQLLVVDHHASNTRFGQINWVVPHASATCELVFHLIREAGYPVGPNIASLLYAGIHTDTVGFTLQTTSASALETAAALVELGARTSEIGERIYRNQHPNEFSLTRLIYDNTKVVADGCIAYSTATYEELTAANCSAADVEDQVDIPRSIAGIKIAILFTEGRPGKIRLNVRGEGDVQVLDIAQSLGGGGHQQAAGATFDGTISEAIEAVIPKAIESLNASTQIRN
jgi:phosphoesterase RecJ-like protein